MRGKKTNQAVQEQIKALYLVKDSISDVARALNMPRKTVESIIKRDDEFAELRLQKKREMIMLANEKAKEFLNELDPKKAKSEMEKSTVFGTLVDKNAVLSGENFKSNSVSVSVGDNRKVVYNVSPNLAKVINKLQGKG